MSSTKRVSIGVGVETSERLAQLEKVTGIPRREHLRRAVARYFDQAADHLTEAAVAELSRFPTSATELERLDSDREPATPRTPLLRKAAKR